MPPAGPEKSVVRWRMASAYSGALPQLGSLAKRVGRNIWEVSNGGIEIAFFEPGTLVPSSQMFDAVASGTIDAAFSSPGFWAAKEPSLQLYSAVPFGPPPGEYLAWAYFGGGQELLNEIYNPHGIHSLICGMIAPESAGWYRRAFTTPEDLNGLKMRASGLGARVLEKLGVKTLALDDADIFLAFENGAIDAAEFSMPAIDLKLGFYELASHLYFPGWQQPSSFFELLINKEKWDALAKTKKSQIQTVCGDNVRYGLAEGEALQYDALKELTAKGVKIQRWPLAILGALEASWKEVAVEQSAANANFHRVWRSLSDFRKEYAIWKELARP
ncbi:MAG: TRAP transporter substrate-binding protein [Rhodospirillales bacterium]|nr:TRAP transporter substrate-binding protein [Rhodospirillales bacterium]